MEKTALEWCKKVGGVSLFPELPVYGRQYYKHWLRDRRVQDGVRKMKCTGSIVGAVERRADTRRVASCQSSLRCRVAEPAMTAAATAPSTPTATGDDLAASEG